MKGDQAQRGGGEDVAEMMSVFGDSLGGDDDRHRPPEQAPSRDQVAEGRGGGDGKGGVPRRESEVFLCEKAFKAAGERVEVEGGRASFPIGPGATCAPFDDRVDAGDDAGEDDQPRAAPTAAVEEGYEQRD